MAADRSAALRAGAAALARALLGDPHVYLVRMDGKLVDVFGSQCAAERWLRDRGAEPHGADWYSASEETYYYIDKIIPM
jgi:hypothetical protein